MELAVIGLSLLALHFGEPVSYYLTLRGNQPSRAKTHSLPFVSIIIPTYNERGRIQGKLRNVMAMYPNDRMEVIVVDSSDDGTYSEVNQVDLPNLRLIREPKRRGKVLAVRDAMRTARGEVIVITDADALWLDRLENAVGILQGEIGAVSCVKYPNRGEEENSYRDFYNRVRLKESSLFSTPVFNGEMVAFRRELISPEELPMAGADDSAIATYIAMKGFRAICVPDFRVVEEVPLTRRDYMSWKVRRGAHLVRHFVRNFWKVVRCCPTSFKFIFTQETFLHTVEPWLLVSGLVLVALGDPYLFLSLAGAASLLLLWRRTRKMVEAWVPNQVFLIASQFYGIRGERMIWRKERKE
jgi:cellulose synthase/poly-beta-1,6-N-acetylglucosamine synthase-like glycosyltransferase